MVNQEKVNQYHNYLFSTSKTYVIVLPNNIQQSCINTIRANSMTFSYNYIWQLHLEYKSRYLQKCAFKLTYLSRNIFYAVK